MGEGGSKKGEKRALAPVFTCFSVPGLVLCKLGRPGVFVLPEVLTPILGPSFVLFSSLLGLLATAIWTLSLYSNYLTVSSSFFITEC